MRNEVENQFRLEGKTILVTGGSSGIGRQTATHIAAMGGRVVVTGRSEERLKETLGKLGGADHLMITADLTLPEDMRRLSEGLPKLDGIVHSAGIVNPYPARFITQAKIDEIFNINYTSAVLLMTALYKTKKVNKNCSVVFISSFSAHFPYAIGAIYVSAKAALEAYSKVLAIENANTGLRANCICPALVKTDMYDLTFNVDNDPNAEEKRKRYEACYPLGIGMPTDVSNACVFFLSDASRWITGQSLIMDGGYLLSLLANPAK